MPPSSSDSELFPTSLPPHLTYFRPQYNMASLERLSLLTLTKGNLPYFKIIYVVALSFHMVAYLPNLLGKKLQRTEKK
jgi:hypothetical protein